MKVRYGFVTNSSSSSFICAFKNMEDGITKIVKQLLPKGEKYCIRVLQNFLDAKQISKDKLIEDLNWIHEFDERYNEKELMDKIGGRDYLVELEYGDHESLTDEELETSIMPYMDFVVDIINNH